MAKKKLGKSSCEGMLHTFIEARCACGACYCRACGGCTDSSSGTSQMNGGVKNTWSAESNYFTDYGAM